MHEARTRVREVHARTRGEVVLGLFFGLGPFLQLCNLSEVQTIHALLSRLIPGVLCKEPCNPLWEVGLTGWVPISSCDSGPSLV